jgi:hypothetical protein
MISALSKNWRQIAKIENVWVRLCLIYTEDAKTLGKLAKAFPKCLNAKDAAPHFPISLIKEVAEKANDGYGDYSTIDRILKTALGFPSVECVPGESTEYNPQKHVSMPAELFEKYDEYRALFENTRNFPFSLTMISCDGKNYYLDEGKTVNHDLHINGRVIILYPADIVEFDDADH